MQIEAAFSLSEEYYKFMSDFAQTSFEDDKLLGKFYTDFTVAKRMVETIVENVKLDVFSRDIKLIDPFCGDGRLISETIIQLIQKDIIHGRKLYISLWDIDEVAVNVAKQNVEEICNAYQLSYEIDAKKYDACCDRIYRRYWYHKNVQYGWGTIKGSDEQLYYIL